MPGYDPRLRLSATDRFLVAKLGQDDAMLPTGDLADRIAAAVGSLQPEVSLVLDTRDLRYSTYDLWELVEAFNTRSEPMVLDYEENRDWVDHVFPTARFLPVRRTEWPVEYEDLDLRVFADAPPDDLQLELAGQLSGDLPSAEEWEYAVAVDSSLTEYYSSLEEVHRVWKMTVESHRLFTESIGGPPVLARRWLQGEIARSCVRSALQHIAVTLGPDGMLRVQPYHSHAVHEVGPREDILLARPSTLAHRTRSILSPALRRLEELINDPGVREADLDEFFIGAPEILGAMGYQAMYSKVVLDRHDGTSLIPDFLVEPVGSSFADILDLKLPFHEALVVGGRDRRRLSQKVQDLVAQLREYGAFFDDEGLAARVEERYGVKCYRPRLVGVIGRAPIGEDERQLRRLMTAYADVRIVTYDELLGHARSRLLI